MVTRRMAITALSGASIVFGITVLNAVNGSSVLAKINELRDRPRDGSHSLIREPALSDAAILFAADHDPFQSNRQRSVDYRLPADLAVDASANTGPIAPQPIPFRVVGAIVKEEGGVALIVRDSGSPQIMTIGDQVDGYVISSLEHDAVTFQGPDGSSHRLKISSGGGPHKKITWTTAARALGIGMGQKATVSCPPGGQPGSIWGVKIYTEDSSVCTAGVHAGLITLEAGGTFIVYREPGRRNYAGNQENGITTQPYGPYPGSFTVAKRVEMDDDSEPEAPEAPPPTPKRPPRPERSH